MRDQHQANIEKEDAEPASLPYDEWIRILFEAHHLASDEARAATEDHVYKLVDSGLRPLDPIFHQFWDLFFLELIRDNRLPIMAQFLHRTKNKPGNFVAPYLAAFSILLGKPAALNLIESMSEEYRKILIKRIADNIANQLTSDSPSAFKVFDELTSFKPSSPMDAAARDAIVLQATEQAFGTWETGDSRDTGKMERRARLLEHSNGGLFGMNDVTTLLDEMKQVRLPANALRAAAHLLNVAAKSIPVSNRLEDGRPHEDHVVIYALAKIYFTAMTGKTGSARGNRQVKEGLETAIVQWSSRHPADAKLKKAWEQFFLEISPASEDKRFIFARKTLAALMDLTGIKPRIDWSKVSWQKMISAVAPAILLLTAMVLILYGQAPVGLMAVSPLIVRPLVVRNERVTALGDALLKTAFRLNQISVDTLGIELPAEIFSTVVIMNMARVELAAPGDSPFLTGEERDQLIRYIQSQIDPLPFEQAQRMAQHLAKWLGTPIEVKNGKTILIAAERNQADAIRDILRQNKNDRIVLFADEEKDAETFELLKSALGGERLEVRPVKYLSSARGQMEPSVFSASVAEWIQSPSNHAQVETAMLVYSRDTVFSDRRQVERFPSWLRELPYKSLEDLVNELTQNLPESKATLFGDILAFALAMSQV